MSGGFFIIGGIIFAVYVYFTIWNINTSAKKNREENYPDYKRVDVVDVDGHGNYGRFPSSRERKKKMTSKQAKERLSKIPLSTERVGKAFINSKRL